ncbi:MAG: hypothetical protein EBY95_07870 [Actinobacteria bacterium]|nr:hypothetical protein [Actinomycetota bacterium]
MNEQIQVIAVRPTASDEEIAVITAAVTALWPKPEPSRRTSRDDTWRFSGRPESKPFEFGTS